MIYPVILSGGSGTRLWPLSRAMYPKQFIDLFDKDGQSLFSATVRRLSAERGFAPPTLICNNDHRFLVRDELENSASPARAILLEPVARNTAPAIAVAALHIVAEEPEAIIAVMPSDHVIKDEAQFASAISNAAQVAAKGRLVLFGIEPSGPHTGYGYIKRGLPSDEETTFTVSQFTEKPNVETAKAYLDSGEFYWNSGIFVLHAKTLLSELGQFEPKVLEAACGALEKAVQDDDFLKLSHSEFAASSSISIDYAVMERTDCATLIPVDMGWSDVGTWGSLWEVGPRDANDNFVRGDAILKETRDCYIRSDKSLVSTIGIDNLVIVDTPDALLVADKSCTQQVGSIVDELRRTNRAEQEQHLRNTRPWGYFETLSIGPRFQVKKLHVTPGSKLSLQMHHHRSEHWVVVKGTARVTIGDSDRVLLENESVYISATQWHRLENPGKVPLEIIEIQTGSYLGEDDIIRKDDVYGREPHETK